MSYQQPRNGRHGGPPPSPPEPWPPPQPSSGQGAGRLFDITKQGISITVLGGIAYALLMGGITIGTYQERSASMQAQLGELKTDVKKIKEDLPHIKAQNDAIQAAVQKILERPQWTMEVRR